MKKSKILIGLALGAAIYLNNLPMVNAVSFYDTIGTKYEGAVEKLAEIKIVSGTSSNVFSPDRNVTRAEFAKMIVEATLTPAQQNALDFDLSNVQNYKDINEKDWYFRYVTIAINNNYMQGFEDGTFRPNKEITYSQIAKIVTKALGHTYLTESDPRGWDALYLDKAFSENLFDHVKFDSPSQNAIRGDVANIIWNTLKADQWHMIQRNDVEGFTYINTGHNLFTSRIVDHVLIEDASIQGYKEINGNIYVQVNGTYYKIFDQKAKVEFSTIGGTSDILLKRVEYPGEEIAYEVVGITTDVGSKLYAGTYAELEQDKIDLTHVKRLSPKSDYAYVYHYSEDPTQDRALAINLSNAYLVDEIKVDQKTPKEEKKDDEKKTSHSKIDNQYQDDMIAYRYNSDEKVVYKTITVNGGELVLDDGVVLFKDNNRVQWNSIKKGDVLIEVTEQKYYFVQTGKEEMSVKLTGYSNESKNYYIETSKGKIEAYDTTMYSDYLTNDVVEFYSLSKSTLDGMIGKNVNILLDMTGRVIKINLLEDELKLTDINVAIYDGYLSKGEKNGAVRLIQDGKSKLYPTNSSPSIDKGSIVKYKLDEKNPGSISNVSKITGNSNLTDKIKISPIELDKLQDRLEYFEDDELSITKITYHYKFGKYQEVSSYDIENPTIKGIKDLPVHKNIKAYVITDKSDVIRYVFVVDDREKETDYYGIVNNIYKNTKDKKTYADITVVGSRAKEYILNNTPECEVGDFVIFTAKDASSISIGERFSPKNLGYYKDLIVEKQILDKYDKPVAYNLSNDMKLDLKEWKITSEDEEYNLKNYEVFLLKVEEEGKYGWTIKDAERITMEKPNFAKDDRIAINEIENTVIVYRGYIYNEEK